MHISPFTHKGFSQPSMHERRKVAIGICKFEINCLIKKIYLKNHICKRVFNKLNNIKHLYIIIVYPVL